MQQFSQVELSKHHDVGDLWVSIRGKVYDLTSYVDDHPGGIEVLKDVAGSDGTESFEYVGHSRDAYETLQQLQIGVLQDYTENVDLESLARAWDAYQPKVDGKPGVKSTVQQVLVVATVIVTMGLMSRWLMNKDAVSEKALETLFAKPHAANWVFIPSFWVSGLFAAVLSFSGYLYMYAKFTKTLEYYKEVWEYPSYFSCKVNKANI